MNKLLIIIFFFLSSLYECHSPVEPSTFSTNFYYEIQNSPGKVTLKIFSSSGNLISTLIDAQLSLGRYTVSWNGKNKNGKKVVQGVYIYILKIWGNDGAYEKIVGKFIVNDRNKIDININIDL